MPETDLALIEQRIYTIRGVRVILDSDLAALYGVPTKRLNEQYRRNRKRFPEDFAFQLTAKEVNSFEVANCDLKFTRWSPVPPLRLHRAWCLNGCEYSKHATSRPDERVRHPRVC